MVQASIRSESFGDAGNEIARKIQLDAHQGTSPDRPTENGKEHYDSSVLDR